MTKFRVRAEVEFTVEGGPNDQHLVEVIAKEALTGIDLPEGTFHVQAVVPYQEASFTGAVARG